MPLFIIFFFIEQTTVTQFITLTNFDDAGDAGDVI